MGHRTPIWAGIALAALFASSVAMGATDVAAPGPAPSGFHPDTDVPAITEFGFPKAPGFDGVALGSDGRIWTTISTHGFPDAESAIGAIDRSTLERSTYPLPLGAGASDIVAGPDGALFATLSEANAIARIATAGAITMTPLAADSGPAEIVLGPDNNLWFTEEQSSKIGKMTPAGAIVDEFPTPTADAGPLGITVGPDGNLWFIERAENKIAALDTDGNVVGEFDVPAAPNTLLVDIVTGPDGNLWMTRSGSTFSNPGQDFLLRFDPTTSMFDEFLLPPGDPAGLFTGGGTLYVALKSAGEIITVANDGSITSTVQLAGGAGPINLRRLDNGDLWVAQDGNGRLGWVQQNMSPPFDVLDLPDGTLPHGITLGPDGNVWFTAQGSDEIGKVSASGDVTTYPLPRSGTDPYSIVTGPDGALWFTEFAGNAVARITTTGDVTEYMLPHSGSSPTGITAGPDGRIWFVEERGAVASIAVDGTDLIEREPPSPGAIDDIVVGPDGRLWFSEFGASKVGAVTTDFVFEEFDLGGGGLGGMTNPEGMVVAPDGLIWYAGFGNSTVGNLTTAGAVTSLATSQFPVGVVNGPDGNVWVNYFPAGKLGSMSNQGIATDYVYTVGLTFEMTVGPDGVIWFTWRDNRGPSRIVRFRPAVPGPAPVPIEPTFTG
ncbi:MAG: virginiamycin B lyase family protein [Acidimicrobiia bacterium]